MSNSPDDPFQAPGSPSNSPDVAFHAPGSATTSVPESPSTPPAGWYADPGAPGLFRWWDGSRWTDQQSPSGMTDPMNATQNPRSKGRNTAFVVLGIVVGLAVLAIVVAGVLQAVRGATGSGETGETLLADVPAEWTTASTLKGAGTFAYDPDWTDAMDFIGADELEEFMNLGSGLETTVDGAWFVNGGPLAGGTVLMVISLPEAPGPSTAAFEVQTYIQGATDGLEGSKTTGQGPVKTKNGLSGYTAEFEYPIYTEVMLNTVGIVVDGKQQVLVSTAGLPSSGSGKEEMLAVLNSLEID